MQYQMKNDPLDDFIFQTISNIAASDVISILIYDVLSRLRREQSRNWTFGENRQGRNSRGLNGLWTKYRLTQIGCHFQRWKFCENFLMFENLSAPPPKTRSYFVRTWQEFVAIFYCWVQLQNFKFLDKYVKICSGVDAIPRSSKKCTHTSIPRFILCVA